MGDYPMELRARDNVGDITEREMATTALMESEQRYRALFEMSPGASFVAERSGNIIDVNESVCRLLGYSRYELVGHNIADITTLSPDEIQKNIAELTHGKIADRVVTNIRKDGAECVLELHETLVRLPDGADGILIVANDISKRVAAEKALRESDEKLRDLVEDIDGIVWECNADTLEFTYMSPRVEAILGYPVQQWYDEPDLWAKIIHSDDRERSIEFYRSRSEEGVDHDFEYRAIAADHRTVWIRDQVRLVRDDEGHVTLLRGIMIDITEQKRSYAVRDGENRVLEKLAKGHSIADVLDELVMTVERAAPGMICSILLLDESDRTLRHGSAPSLPDEYNQLIDGLEIGPQVGSCGTAAYLNQRVIVEDTFSDPLWEKFREIAKRFNLRACWSNPVVSSDGQVLGTLAMYYRKPRQPTDKELELITTAANLTGVAIDHDRTIRARRDVEEKFRNLFDHSPSAIFVESMDGIVLDANAAACELHGVARDQLVGRNVLELVPEETHEQVTSDFRRVVKGELVEFEGYSRHVGGQAIPVSIRVNSIEYDGEPCLLLHVQDITKRKRAEDEFQKQQGQLAHVSRLSTMGQMVAGIAHELNQPLFSISNFATACSRVLESADEPNAKLLNWTRKIADQANRSGEIIRRLKDYSRKDIAKHAHVDLNVLVRDSIDLVASEARRNDIDIDCEFLEPPVVVYVDEIQIQQTLVNLLQNAFQALEPAQRTRKTVVVRIIQTECDEDTKCVQIDIEDNGIGLPEGGVDSLYDAFYTTKRDGMGMGLAISRSIVDFHSGRLWASSNTDDGTTFHFTLPIPGTTEIRSHV